MDNMKQPFNILVAATDFDCSPALSNQYIDSMRKMQNEISARIMVGLSRGNVLIRLGSVITAEELDHKFGVAPWRS